MRLIDSDNVIKRAVMFEEMTGERLNQVHDFVSSEPTVETAVLSTHVLVARESLAAPWCEQYVKDMIARNIAKELVERIEIIQFTDYDISHAMTAFRAKVVIIPGDIENAPTIDPVKRGRWIKMNGERGYECSRCGWESDTTWDFCPNCGALNIEAWENTDEVEG